MEHPKLKFVVLEKETELGKKNVLRVPTVHLALHKNESTE
jgi:hypothetical protein